jgi:hypothetical protein
MIKHIAALFIISSCILCAGESLDAKKWFDSKWVNELQPNVTPPKGFIVAYKIDSIESENLRISKNFDTPNNLKEKDKFKYNELCTKIVANISIKSLSEESGNSIIYVKIYEARLPTTANTILKSLAPLPQTYAKIIIKIVKNNKIMAAGQCTVWNDDLTKTISERINSFIKWSGNKL